MYKSIRSADEVKDVCQEGCSVCVCKNKNFTQGHTFLASVALELTALWMLDDQVSGSIPVEPIWATNLELIR